MSTVHVGFGAMKPCLRKRIQEEGEARDSLKFHAAWTATCLV